MFEEAIIIHECEFYVQHRENGPRTFCIYCKECIQGWPLPAPEDQIYAD